MTYPLPAALPYAARIPDHTGAAVTEVNLPARVRRLAQLVQGLVAEQERLHEDCGPFQPNEWRAYLAALQGAASGLNNARVVLVKALARIECDQEHPRKP